jgi:hypothetical protein
MANSNDSRALLIKLPRLLVVTIILASVALSLLLILPASAVTTTDGGGRTLSITAMDANGNALSMWTAIKNASTGETVFTGFSPVEFQADSSEFYIISVSNYGTYYFDHWADSNLAAATACNCDLPDAGTSIPFRYIPDDGNSYTLSAVYRTAPFPEGTTPLYINSKNAEDGSDLDGMYVMVFKKIAFTNPNTGEDATRAIVDATGWTSFTHVMQPETSYLVEAIDYAFDPNDVHSKALIFDHWEDDGSTNYIKEVPAGSPATTLTAYYREVPDVCPSCT